MYRKILKNFLSLSKKVSPLAKEHERQFAYEAHTVCDRHGMILGAEVTAGNIHDSAAWDAVYRHGRGVQDPMDFKENNR
ncbi:MAG: hypothetical protein LUH42_02350 [Oscillospiraceae bacterium]|nr:hypothetical protein [Oscillospiraceae bacterium]